MSFGQPRFQVVTSAQYSPEIGSFVAMLEHCRESVLDSVRELTVDQLSHQHDAKANTIGSLLAHIAAVEWYFATVSIAGKQPESEEWGEFGTYLRLMPATWAATKGQSIEQHIERLARIRARTLAGLQARDDAWLLDTFTLPWTTEPANNRWALFHLLEDEFNHRGQIRWLKSRLP